MFFYYPHYNMRAEHLHKYEYWYGKGAGMRSKILVVTASDEPNVPKVWQHFETPEVVFRLDTDRLADYFCDLRTGSGGTEWSFRKGAESIRKEEVRSIWYRRPGAPKAPADMDPQEQGFAENESQKFLRALWSTLGKDEAYWMNDPSTLRELEFNKPLQSQVAAEAGLLVPETLITTDPREAVRFWERWRGEVIHKTFGGFTVQNPRGKALAIYTSRVTREDLETFGEDIRHAPVLFQNYIPKAFELRVTVVAERVFACAIHSQDSPRTRDDWRRYDFDRVRHRPYLLPAEIQMKLLKFMKELRLVFGAIDMVVTPDNEFVFLEVNPSGQWGWIEKLTGLPISKAIAETLSNPPLR